MAERRRKNEPDAFVDFPPDRDGETEDERLRRRVEKLGEQLSITPLVNADISRIYRSDTERRWNIYYRKGT